MYQPSQAAPPRYTERRGDVVLATPPSHVTDTSIQAFLAEMESYLQGDRPYAVVFDMSRAGTPSAQQRGMLSRHLDDHGQSIRSRVRGMAFVAPSAVTRGMITAVFWLSPPPIPHRSFETFDEAFRWAESLT